MNPNLQFEFIIDKTNHTINIKRSFDAGLELVWNAWTKPEILVRWWAPKPYRVHTKSMDFREGGAWHYAMISPQNEAHWCRNDYQQIERQKSFRGLNTFCDEQGTTNTALPQALWENVFSKTGELTLVSIQVTYENLAGLEKIIEMGFKEGITMAMENLDQYLASQFQLGNENKIGRGPRVCSYLNFPGTAEEAFLFYRSVFKTEFTGRGLQRFGDLPAGADHPPVAEEIKKMILHIELPITGGHILKATDAPKEMGFNLSKGNTMHLSIEPESRKEADRLFSELSEGGQITMPMADMFFGAYFGQFTDRYGVNWMINHPTGER